MAKKAVSKKITRKKKPARTTKKVTAPTRRVKHSRPAPRKFDQGIEEFGQEVSNLGERFGKHMEKKGKEMETSWNKTLGITGPFISSVFGIVMLAILLWIFNLVSVPLGSGFLSSLYSFVFSNLALFFAFFLFFSYTSYMHKRSRRVYMPISPVVTAIGITIGFWILMSALNLINLSFSVVYLTTISQFIQYNLLGIFTIFLLLGYLVLFVGALTGKFGFNAGHCMGNTEGTGTTKQIEKRVASRPVSGAKRLYRSGREKILGGVCGGMAEYFGVDPVLIRLLWIVFALGWGSGILVYIIAWVIISRNPRDAKNWD
jgi:phage shock protein PspC (stress-responsive transcriptional regulator)